MLSHNHQVLDKGVEVDIDERTEGLGHIGMRFRDLMYARVQLVFTSHLLQFHGLNGHEGFDAKLHEDFLELRLCQFGIRMDVFGSCRFFVAFSRLRSWGWESAPTCGASGLEARCRIAGPELMLTFVETYQGMCPTRLSFSLTGCRGRSTTSLDAWPINSSPGARLATGENVGAPAWRGPEWRGTNTWAWVKIKPPGNEPQVLVLGSIYQGNPFWGYPVFDPEHRKRKARGFLLGACG